MRKLTHYQGASLVELLIASSLGLIIIAGLVRLYLQQQAAFQYETGLARIQENGRIADYLLRQDVRSAGYMGCAQDPAFQSGKINLNTLLVGFEKGSSSSSLTLPDTVIKQLKSYTDVLRVSQLKVTIASIATEIAQHAVSIPLLPQHTLPALGMNIIADCSHAEAHRIKSITNNRVAKLTTPIKQAFAKHAQLGELQTALFFIGDTQRKNSQGQPIYALNRYVLNKRNLPHELIDGVEEMQVRYGMMVQQQLVYLPASKIGKADWNKVLAVKIHLLLNSVEPAAEKPQPYFFMGQSYIAHDRLLRREWVTHMALRERL